MKFVALLKNKETGRSERLFITWLRVCPVGLPSDFFTFLSLSRQMSVQCLKLSYIVLFKISANQFSLIILSCNDAV